MTTTDTYNARSSLRLFQFYEHWLYWAVNIKTENGCFNPSVGLCYALGDWHRINFGDDPENKARLGLLKRELVQQFHDAGLSQGFPFGATDYHYREFARTQHECPHRLYWVRERIADGVKHVAAMRAS